MAQGRKLFSNISLILWGGVGLGFTTIKGCVLATASCTPPSNLPNTSSSPSNPVIHIYPDLKETPSAKNAAIDSLMLNRQDFQDFQQRDAIRGLAPVTSLQVSQLGADTPGLFVQLRGADPGQTPVQILGVPIADPSAGDRFDFSTLPLSAVDRLEINNFSAQSGLSGCVQVETRRGQGSSNYQGRVERGSFDSQSVSLESQGASVKHHGANHHYFVTGTLATSGEGSLKNKRLGNDTADCSRQRSLATRMGATLHPQWESEIYASYNRNGVKINDIMGPLPVNSPNHLVQQQGIFISRNYFKTFHKRWHHTLLLSGVTHRRDTLIKGQPYFSVGNTISALYENNFILNPSSPQTLKSFVGVKKDCVHANTVGFQPRQTWQSGVSYQRPLLRHLSLDLRSRWEKAAPLTPQNASYGQLRAQIHPMLTLWTRTGTGFQLPPLTALYASLPSIISNPALKPLTSHQTDVGFAFNLQDRLTVSISHFWLNIKNFITVQPMPGGRVQYVNEDQRRTCGLEASFQLKPFDAKTQALALKFLKLRGGYTYLDARNLQRQQRPLRLARHVYTGGIDVPLSDEWQMFGEGRWQSTTLDLDFFTGQHVRLPAQVSLRAGAVYKIHSQLDLTVRMENLLNAPLESVYGYPQRGFEIFVGVVFRDNPLSSFVSQS